MLVDTQATGERADRMEQMDQGDRAAAEAAGLVDPQAKTADLAVESEFLDKAQAEQLELAARTQIEMVVVDRVERKEVELTHLIRLRRFMVAVAEADLSKLLHSQKGLQAEGEPSALFGRASIQ